jgi:uncharacterized membrane protein
MAGSSVLGKDDADTVIVSALLIYAATAAACSSPQTAEINANKRAETLMKWVKLGLVQGAVICGAAVYVAKQSGHKAWPILLGAGLAAGMMWASYQHALSAGLASDQPGTEQY